MSLFPKPWYYHMNEEGPVKDILRKRIERQRKKSLGFLVKNGDRIPEHLIVEILSWLPVQTLKRFKTVCKSWYAIIKSAYFTTKHLRNNYYDNKNNRCDRLIVQYAITQAGELSVFELLIDDKKNRTLDYQEIYTPMYNTYLCGPCDGIYYLWIFYNSSHRRSMWNPALSEFIILPDIPLNNSAFTYESYGFGYDTKTEDYKVILILGERHENSMTILIYSLKTNSWRNWGDTNNSYQIQQNESYVLSNGCYYWLASSVDHAWDYEMILAFDIAGDAYHEISLPHFENNYKPGRRSHVSVYYDSIAFVHVPDDNASSFTIWTWFERGWTPKLSVKLDYEVRGAVTHWRDNMLVIKIAGSNLILYDKNTEEIFNLKSPSEGRVVNICAYKESLVSIIGFLKNNKPH